MTTAIGIRTPEGIVLASDMLKVKGEIINGKLRITERNRGYRKITPSYDKRSLVVYACTLSFPQHFGWLEDLVNEVMQTAQPESIPTQFREAVSKVLRTDEFSSITQYGNSITEFHGLIAYLSENQHNLVYQHLAHPHKAVTDYKAIGSGGDYARPFLINCKSITEAVEVAEASIKEAARHRKSISKGLNIYTLDALEGAREIKFVE